MTENIIQQEELLSKGYGIIPKLAMKDARLSIEAKAIYAYLSSYCGAGNIAFPSVELICHDLNISEKRFNKYKKQLVDCGYIVIERQRLNSGFSNNIYTLPKSVSSQFVPLQIVPEQFVRKQNVGTNNNSPKSNSINKDTMSGSEKAEQIPYKKIIDHLNKATDSKFSAKASANQKLIKARWNEGNELQIFLDVIDLKNEQWKDNEKMAQYLRPSTLFGATNFENYKAEVMVQRKKEKSNFSDKSKIDYQKQQEELRKIYEQ
jgi:uncharacterized phage protein (TIGR02220 family)